MKMFLTRLGEGSRMVITGDRSQIDLPRGVTSGLHDAERLLSDVEGHLASATSPRRTSCATPSSRDHRRLRHGRRVTTIDIVIEDPRWEALPLLQIARAGIDAALAAAEVPEGYEIAVMGCDDARIARLNAAFRDKPMPTNVLSWPAFDLAPLVDGDPPGRPPVPGGFDDTLGDIALAYETCIREAREQGKPVEHHLTHLVLHGTLHLLGFDHVRDGDAHRMETLESAALVAHGIPDPYA